MLKLIQRRIQVEIDAHGRIEIKLLARLLREETETGRKQILTDSLKRIESVLDFESFLEAGIEHMRKSGDSGRRHQNSQDVVHAPIGTLALMKEILDQVQDMKTKLSGSDRDVYSTFSEIDM